MQTLAPDRPSNPPAAEPSIAGDPAGNPAGAEPLDAVAVVPPKLKGLAMKLPVKRKRGRPPKNKGDGAVKKGKEEEEVCFICFDGGDLVVCDRKSCPKVYHPVCVNRDANFFRARGRWNCGWHICSMCAKAANYMCYTCTYSLCKVCIRKVNFSCIRGNDGFCEACLRLVTLIESNGHGNDEKIFDDKNNWEYLFKLYWLAVKKKLTITVEELNTVRNSCKGSDFAKHDLNYSNEQPNNSGVPNCKQEVSSDSSWGHHEGSDISIEPQKQTRELASGEGPNKSVDRDDDNGSLCKKLDSEPKSVPEDRHWASPVLLEFVSHMKHGDVSALTQVAIHELLLKYVEKNNLCDPHNKNQIICDKMLLKLFGKACLECFEMLNLIESHLLVKVASQADDNHGGIADPDSAQMDAEENCDMVACRDKKRKIQSNVDDYAAINIHNINLIYLRQSLIEDLLNDTNVFREKVVGSFVRMRLPGMCQNQDMYRLVQVVGTQTVAEKYDVGKKTIDVALEVLNLNKTEVLSIDAISNEDFTEEECRQLQQTMEYGLMKRLKVGVIQEKAKGFQATRVNDWLESERLRLGHLRDRASEAGCTEELSLYDEKLQLLSKPEEHIHWLNEVPEIHVDRPMDSNCEPPNEETRQMKKGYYSRLSASFDCTEAKEVISLCTGGPDISHNLHDTQIDSRSISLANQSWEHGGMENTSILVTQSANCGPKGDAPKPQEGSIAASPEMEKIKYGNAACIQDPGNPKCSIYADCSVNTSPSRQDKVNHGPIVENCTTDAAKIFRSTGQGFDTKCNCSEPRETFSDAKLQLALTPMGQCNDPLKPPSSTPEFNNEVAKSVLRPVSIPSTSTVVVVSLASSSNDATQSAEVSTHKELLLVHTNEPDAGKVSEAHDTSSVSQVSYPSSSPKCELQECSCVPENEPDAVKLTETQKNGGGENLAALSMLHAEYLQGKTSPVSECETDALRAKGNGLSPLCLQEEKHVSLIAIDDKTPNQCAMASTASEYVETNSVLILKSEEIKSELQELPTSSQKDNPENSKPDPPSSGATLEQNKAQKPELGFLNPDQIRLSKLEDEIETSSIEWSLLSPASASKPPDREIMPCTMTGKLTETQKNVGGEYQAALSMLHAEYLQGKTSPVSECETGALQAKGNGLSPLCLQEERHVSLIAIDDKTPNQCAMASTASEYVETNSVPILKSEEIKSELQELPTSSQKDEPENSKPDPPSSGATLEQNKTQKPELGFLNPDQIRLSKLEDEIETSRIEWSLLSPAPASKPPDREIMPCTMAGNNQSRPFLYSDSLVTTDSYVLVIPVSNSDDEDTLSKCLEEALQTTEEDQGSAVTNEDLQGIQAKADTDAGWGAFSLGNIDLDWEPPSPLHAYASEGWGALFQGNALSPVHSIADVGLGAFSPVYPNVDLGLPSPIQSNSNACWGVPYQGNMNLNVGPGESIPGNTSPIWGPFCPEGPGTLEMFRWNTDSNLDTRQRGFQNAGCSVSELGSDASRGFPCGDFSITRQNGEKNSEHGASHCGGRISTNGYYGGNGGFSHQSGIGHAKGQRVVCDFYQKGYCTKGASCNYRHPGYQD